MPQTRVPEEADFAPLAPQLTISLAFPSPPESTTAILLLFHGLGDIQTPFADFARHLALPGVLGVAVRGTNPLPPALLGLEPDYDGPTNHFHWGDDLKLGSDGELEQDPGFEKAKGLVLGKLVKEVLVEKCGWETRDILLFGFGQGGSFALGLASMVRIGLNVGGPGSVLEEGEAEGGKLFKGVLSIGGGLLSSMIPAVGEREKSKTPVLVLHGSESEGVDEFAADVLRQEFEEVKVVKWKRPDDGMPRSREEVLPMMEFFAERLAAGDHLG